MIGEGAAQQLELVPLSNRPHLSYQEKEDYMDLTCDDSLKRKFNSGSLTNFWISFNGKYPQLW